VVMEVAFNTRNLRTLCEDLGVARDLLGMPAADQLKARLADLRASDNVQEFLDLGLNGVELSASGALTVELSQGHRMLVMSNQRTGRGRPEPVEELRDLRRVQVIQIL
jgi:hypothetical protein